VSGGEDGACGGAYGIVELVYEVGICEEAGENSLVVTVVVVSRCFDMLMPYG
jgi:hypothetical protein